MPVAKKKFNKCSKAGSGKEINLLFSHINSMSFPEPAFEHLLNFFLQPA